MHWTPRAFVALFCLVIVGDTEACGGHIQTSPVGAAAADAGTDAGAPASTKPGTAPVTVPTARPASESWCNSDKTGPHEFCSDFDDSETGPWGWDELLRGDSNSPDVYGVTLSNRSPPNGFHQQST